MAESSQLNIQKITPEQAATVLAKVVRRRITNIVTSLRSRLGKYFEDK